MFSKVKQASTKVKKWILPELMHEKAEINN